MIFNRHSDLEGRHALLSASKSSWVNYDDDEAAEFAAKSMAAARGSKMHDLARKLIELRVPLPNTGQTLNMYVNDAIGFRMAPEVVLFYSYNAFGTADAISFRDRLLRIFDLKTGVNATQARQLEVYAALFCLEYKVRPGDIGYDLRIYQNDDVIEFDTDPDRILHLMERIVALDKILTATEEDRL